MEGKVFFFLYVFVVQLEVFASIKGRTVDDVTEDIHTYRVNSKSSPTNLTCFPSTEASPSVFIHELSRFSLVLNAENENGGHGYLCRRITNHTDLLQQYRELVIDVRINETLPVPMKPVVSSCIPISVLMPLLAVVVVSVILNIHLLLQKRQRRKQKRAAGLKAIDEGSGSDESLLNKSGIPGIVITDENHKGDGSHDSNGINDLKNDIAANTTWLHSKVDRRRRLGSTNSPLEERKARADTIIEYKIPKIGFEDGPVLPPQTSHFVREKEQHQEGDSVFQPAIGTRKVPYYPVLDEPSTETNTNQGFQSNGNSKDDLAKPYVPTNGTAGKADYHVETNLGNQEYILPESNNAEGLSRSKSGKKLADHSQESYSRGIGFHLPETDDNAEPAFNSAVGMDKDIGVGDFLPGRKLGKRAGVVKDTQAVPAVEKEEGEASEPEISASGRGDTLPEDSNRELDTDGNGGFQPDRNLFGTEEENVLDRGIPRISNDSGEGFQPQMSLSGRDDFQPFDDIPRNRGDSRGFQPQMGHRLADVGTPNYGIPSFYNDDNEGFQPSMSLSDRDDEPQNDNIPRINNFGFQPEKCKHDLDDLPSETQEDDAKTEDSFSDPLEGHGRGRSNTIEEYHIPTIPFGEDSIDIPVVSASAARANRAASEEGNENEDSSIMFGVSADDKDSTLNTDSFA